MWSIGRSAIRNYELRITNQEFRKYERRSTKHALVVRTSSFGYWSITTGRNRAKSPIGGSVAVGDGVASIVGDGVASIVGEGVASIVGDGVASVVGEGVTSIVGEGVTSIVGEGVTSIVGEG
ncbi:MAG TPA: hypothetical protein PK205_18790, partial [Promineifilum sp.]|nr:hypothetical protein [Promineifilum sp.]